MPYLDTRSQSSTRSIPLASTLSVRLSNHCMALPNYLAISILAPLLPPFRQLGLQVICLLRIKLLDRIGCLRSVPTLVRIGCLQFVLLLQDFNRARPRPSPSLGFTPPLFGWLWLSFQSLPLYTPSAFSAVPKSYSSSDSDQTSSSLLD